MRILSQFASVVRSMESDATFGVTTQTSVVYGLLCLYENITRRCFNRAAKYEAIYENGGFIVKVPAICDSGNRLCDSFTGTPVVVFCCDRLFYHYDLDRDEPDPLSGFKIGRASCRERV